MKFTPFVIAAFVSAATVESFSLASRPQEQPGNPTGVAPPGTRPSGGVGEVAQPSGFGGSFDGPGAGPAGPSGGLYGAGNGNAQESGSTHPSGGFGGYEGQEHGGPRPSGAGNFNPESSPSGSFSEPAPSITAAPTDAQIAVSGSVPSTTAAPTDAQIAVSGSVPSTTAAPTDAQIAVSGSVPSTTAAPTDAQIADSESLPTIAIPSLTTLPSGVFPTIIAIESSVKTNEARFAHPPGPGGQGEGEGFARPSADAYGQEKGGAGSARPSAGLNGQSTDEVGSHPSGAANPSGGNADFPMSDIPTGTGFPQGSQPTTFMTLTQSV